MPTGVAYNTDLSTCYLELKIQFCSDDPDAADDYQMPTEEEIVVEGFILLNIPAVTHHLESPDPKEFCSCKNCPKMPTLEESVCCKTSKKFKNKDGTGTYSWCISIL